MNPGAFDGLDRITLTGVTAHGHHGVLPQERQNGQPFVVDVVLHCETRQAAHTDRLEDTVDYAGVADAIVTVIQGEPVNLIEMLAERIAKSIFDAVGDGVSKVALIEVTVHKPQAPIPHTFEDVSITIVRFR